MSSAPGFFCSFCGEFYPRADDGPVVFTSDRACVCQACVGLMAAKIARYHAGDIDALEPEAER